MSKRLSLTTLVLALLTLTVAGCRIHREAAQGTPANPRGGTETPSDPANPPAYVPKYYTANFACTTQGISAKGQLRLQPDSVLWASASKIIELGRARLTPDSVLVYVKLNNSCFRGTYIDLYRRFGYRTSFDEVVKMVTADDAEKQIATLLGSLNLDATVEMDSWQQAQQLSFPIPIPANAKPL
jgi:hypothetical protein